MADVGGASNPLMLEVLSDVLNVLDEHGLFCDEQIGILGHTLVKVVMFEYTLRDYLFIRG